MATASKEGYHTATATADVIINDPSSPITSGIAMFDFVNEDYGMTRRPSGYNEDGLQIVNQSVTLTSNKMEETAPVCGMTACVSIVRLILL